MVLVGGHVAADASSGGAETGGQQNTGQPSTSDSMSRLHLPCGDAQHWERIEDVLRRPLESWAALDGILTEFALGVTDQTCSFFTTIPNSEDAGCFDFQAFWEFGLPFMLEVALEMPQLFEGRQVDLLLKGMNHDVRLTRRQCACLLAHSFFGSINADARKVNKEKWAFRAAQLAFLQALPSAFCFLNYFKLLGRHGIPDGELVYARRGCCGGPPPWQWQGNSAPLASVDFSDAQSIEDCPAEMHADFANRFVGGGCLENDFHQEEILFATKPELIVAMALTSYMHDAEVVNISGALQFSVYSGYASSFEFLGDYDGRRRGEVPPTIVAMDALQGAKFRQFEEGLVLRDLNKARVAFDGARTIATGNWGCGAFGNDHTLKFLQQWMAASDAGATRVFYHTYGDKRAAPLPGLAASLKHLTVGGLWSRVRLAAQEACQVLPPPMQKTRFLELMTDGSGASAAQAQEP